jgi:NADPH-dependent curcumin reductase
MPQTNSTNRKIVLCSRPIGPPTFQNFRLEETHIPALLTGQILLRTQYLSLDPYMRGRMSDGPSYAASMEIGDVMVGGTVSHVEHSSHPDYKVGDLVLGYCGWQDYAVSDGKGLTKLNVDKHHPSLALGVLGMPGFTAYMGLLDIGQPKSGETVVVAAASGAVGAVVGQIAKIKECRAIGIAGGPEKCRYVIDELGFDACIDHHSPDFSKHLAATCPKGIDVYFESVGGEVFDAVMPLLNTKARIPLCGLVANYNDTELPNGPDRLGLLTRTILSKRLRMQGFIIFDDYGKHFPEFFGQMSSWLWEGRIKYREDIVEGLENAPEAFIGLLKGKNFGKLIIQVSNK